MVVITSLFAGGILFGMMFGFSLPKDARTRITAIYKGLLDYRQKEKMNV